ncbi:hypothetical protein Ait01nite_077840 [Actinoplanes italicus]|nr:hypothetical protein Ait01nite_077840 [Actinoplanes italicus]
MVVDMTLHWWSIEIVDGPHSSAGRWRDMHQETIVSSGISFGAREWHWRAFSWGVLLEIAFADEEIWPAFRALPVVRAALDAVPDPVHGLHIYPGRGGSSGGILPRRPRPTAGAGAVPIPREEPSPRVTLASPEPAPTTSGVTV